MTDHVVRATPRELRAGWWPLVGLACCAGSALLVLAPLVLWFLDQDVKRQGEIVETVLGAVIVIAVGLLVVEVTARVDRRWRP